MSVKADNPEAALDPRQLAARPSDIWRRRFTTLAPVWTLLVMLLLFSLASDSFHTFANFNNILTQVATAAILAVGMTFVLLTGEIDLSVASIMALSAMISAQLYHNFHWPEPLPTIAALLTGTLLGLFSGVMSTLLRIPTFMSTLAMSLIAEGATLWISHGIQFFSTDISPVTIFLGSAKIGGDNGLRSGVLILVAGVSLLIGFLVLRYTRFGRYVYATGANRSAARLAGINTNRTLMAVLTICGFTAALAGLVNTGRIGTAPPAPEPAFLIDAIAVVVLGGTSLTGGRGGMAQTLVGVLIYGTLNNGLDNIANIDSFEKKFITGVVLLAALVINVVFSGKADRDRT
ncbi:MAG: ABC transporter permease [Aggregatilineales bacterium]